MRALSFFAALLVTLPNSSASQQVAPSSSTPSTQASQLLQQSLAALQGNTSISDVTLSGSARRIAGSDDETGTGTVKALAGTGIRIDLSLPSGPRSEVRNISGTEPVGSWSGPDAVSHAMSNHNLCTDPGWFPAFALSSVLSAPNAVITYVGAETFDGQAVRHVSASQISSIPDPPNAPTFQHLTQVDFFLDSTTFLPVAITFNIHPDNNASLDLPVKVRFSDYRIVSGAQIPFHVQKFLNNSLMLDLRFQTATLNSGLSAATFSVQ